ncbi:MAG TPA: hypothetical protein VKD65_12070 [Candidatus Angelobacter sp.]|nr:hypothetical protein [Candidatus Angelobacter sp.]
MDEQKESLSVGDVVTWHRVCSNYGHIDHVTAVVRKIGKRITVEVPLKKGGTKLVCVTPERLKW